MPNRIPINKAKEIAKEYKYDQVIILARKVGRVDGEWVTTYGVDKQHCNASAKIGDALRGLIVGDFKLIRVPKDKDSTT